MPPPRQPTIAHHLILTGYGHWLPNDPRGSGSTEIRQNKLAEFGPVHFGRKRQQPPRDELRAFQASAQPCLAHDILWFDASMREAIGACVGKWALERNYTIWACSVLKNHLHLCVRKHRDSAQVMLDSLAIVTSEAIRLAVGSSTHPVWADRPYKKFLSTPDAVRRVIAYIEQNPVKEGLPPQRWPFVVPYDGWPFHKRRAK